MEKNWLGEIEKAAKNLEFSSFLLGVVLSSEMEKGLSEEERLAVKSKIKRELGMKLEKKWKKLRRKVDFKEPEALFTVNFHRKHLDVSLLPLFVYGRYLKFSREIPQSKWPCSRCSGGGCPHCDGKGSMYVETVEGIAAAPLLRESGASSTKMHAVGREDIDARMLGSGRPFVLELAKPKKRKLNLKKLEKEINQFGKGKIAANGLRFVGKDAIEMVKSAQPPKTYSLKVKCPRAITAADIGKLLKLGGTSISQRTPERVLHRRADLERTRRLLKVGVKQIDKKTFEITVKAQSGTYIKELVTGDKGRTRPSISQALRCRCVPSDLDVTDVDFELK